MKSVKVWKRMGRNSILGGEGFYISYNPLTLTDIPLWAGDGSGEETALCFGDEFFILNGDYRDEYEKAIDEGLSACIKVFRKHEKGHKSSWSNDLPAIRKLKA